MALIEFKNKPDLTTPITADALNHNFNELLNKSISESGSNNYGDYVKFADGTMICYRKVQVNIACTTQWGSLFVGVNQTQWDFAQAFIEKPLVQVSLFTTTSSSAWQVNFELPVITESYIQNLNICRATGSDSVACEFHILAIGKWK